MNVTLTISTWDFKHLGSEYASAARVIEKIHSLGYGTELWLNWDAEPEFYDRANWDDLRTIVGASPALSFHTRNQQDRMFEEIELLAYLGGRALVVHPCVVSLAEYRQERPAGHPDVPFIRDLAAAARQHGVFLALENIFARTFLDRTLEHVETFDERGGLGICIDLGHAEMRRDEVHDAHEAPETLIGDYGPVLLHLHVHDVVDGRDHKPLGTGSLNYDAIAAALRDVDFHGTAALEIQADDPVATIHEGWQYLKQAFGDDLNR
ncbi:MAG TPA: TIM barrel protein [Phycisphaerae bacterium]|nr:TIM barrel protein [Phycisphaerae bacterium]